jgi:hypothetical protein
MKFALRLVFAVTFVAIAAAVLVAGGIKISTQYDRQFKFAGLTTYAWDPTGAGEVKLLQADGNAADIQRRLEPMVVQAVDDAMKQRGFTKDTSGQPAFHVNYYALIGAGTDAQTMGQFLPAVVNWGIPPFPAATQSLKNYEKGSLILDVTAVSLKAVVWRGIAEAEIDMMKTDAQRQVRITDAINQMLKKFPPKK